MNEYMIRYSDGNAVRVKASDATNARNKGYNLNRSGVIASIEQV